MMGNRLFYYSLTTSLIIHLAILTYLSVHYLRLWQKDSKQTEVTYQVIKKKRAEVDKEARNLKIIKEEKPLQDIKVLTAKTQEFFPQAKDMKDVPRLSDKLGFGEKLTPKLPTLEGDRKISIPFLQSEKISNPKYLSYNDAIRQKIKSKAYTYIDNPDFKAGEVYLTFILSSDGNLKQIKIIDEKTNANEYLRSIGQKSIEESSPFPPFPTDLNYPELTFNAVISFEVKE